MPLIDERGYLLGVVNVIDALVVLVLLAAALAGAGLVAGGGDTTTEEPATVTVTVQAEVPDWHAAAIADEVRSPGDHLVRYEFLHEYYEIETGETVKRVRVTAEVSADRTLRVGQQATLQTETVQVTGVVVEVQR